MPCSAWWAVTEAVARCRCLRCGAGWVDRLVPVRGPGLTGWAWETESCPRCGGLYWERQVAPAGGVHLGDRRV